MTYLEYILLRIKTMKESNNIIRFPIERRITEREKEKGITK
jgi:hypothetical protein